MKTFRNENRTMSLHIDEVGRILESFDELVKRREHYFFGADLPYTYVAEYVHEGKLALLTDCHCWTLVDMDEVEHVIQSNELKLVKEFTMPTNSRDWAIALSEFMKVGKHGIESEYISPLLKVFGNGQPCGLVSVQGEYLGQDTVSKAKAEAFLHMGILPIPKFDMYEPEHFAKAWSMVAREGCMVWGLHDHKNAHC